MYVQRLYREGLYLLVPRQTEETAAFDSLVLRDQFLIFG
jgi:hypothetical protein